jgi:hypothetical protein
LYRHGHRRCKRERERETNAFMGGWCRVYCKRSK